MNISLSPRLSIDTRALNDIIKSSDGPVAKRISIIGDEIQAAVRAQLKPGFVKDWLGPRIVKRFDAKADGLHVLVGSDNYHTDPHPIDGDPVLVFDWPKAGGVVFFRHVNHPGSNFGPYLEKLLLKAAVEVRAKL